MTTDQQRPFRIRSLTTALYLPNFLFSVGRGLTVPIIALLALDLGATPAVAGVMVALRGIGTMAFDLPAGVLISRLGEKRSMVAAGAGLAAISLAIWTRPPLWLYAVLIVAMGATWSVWHIARIAYATGAAELEYRGRVMSMIGGSTRVGQLVGPLLGSVVIAGRGLSEAFLLLTGLAGAAALSMALARAGERAPEAGEPGDQPRLGRVVADYRHILATAGTVALIAQVLRSSREVLIPLWGDHLGIAAGTIPLVFAASYALETMVFYPVGLVMDRKGRKWAAGPCIAVLSVGLALIPLTSDVVTLTVVAMVIGLGNGLGAGMNMTLGSDLSPAAGRSRFLGVWRLVTDVGNVAGPLLVAGVTSVAALAAGAVVVGGVGVVGLLVLWRLVPETLVREGPETVPET